MGIEPTTVDSHMLVVLRHDGLTVTLILILSIIILKNIHIMLFNMYSYINLS